MDSDIVEAYQGTLGDLLEARRTGQLQPRHEATCR